MRKNLLIATLIGLSVINLTACGRGEENKSTDQTNQAAAMAPTTEQVQTIQQPTQTTDNTISNPQTMPAQTDVSQNIAATSDNNQPVGTAPATTDTTTPPPATDTNGVTTTPPADAGTSPASTAPSN